MVLEGTKGELEVSDEDSPGPFGLCRAKLFVLVKLLLSDGFKYRFNDGERI